MVEFFPPCGLAAAVPSSACHLSGEQQGGVKTREGGLSQSSMHLNDPPSLVPVPTGEIPELKLHWMPTYTVIWQQR